MNILRRDLASTAVFLCLSFGFLVADLTSAQEFETPSLTDVVTEDPGKEVELHIDLHRIFRGDDIDELLEDFELRVTNLEFKNVGSGGGGFSVPRYDSFSEYFVRAERGHISQLARIGGFDSENLPPCEIEDSVAPINHNRGVPASYIREAACGLRIHKLTVKGRATSALDFVSSVDPNVVYARLMPSDYDKMRLAWYMSEDFRTSEFLQQVRDRFSEYDPKDFPK